MNRMRVALGRTGRATAAATLLTFMSMAATAHADAPPTPTEPPAAAPASSVPASSSMTTEPPAEASHRTVWPWVIMGTGIALVATAIALQVVSVSQDDKRSTAEQQLFPLQPGDPNRAALQASIKSHDDSAKSDRTAALLVGSVGFVAIAGAVVLWFYEGGSSSSSTPPAATARTPLKASFVPALSPNHAGASFGLTF